MKGPEKMEDKENKHFAKISKLVFYLTCEDQVKGLLHNNISILIGQSNVNNGNI
jgi:hypothetical protein